MRKFLLTLVLPLLLLLSQQGRVWHEVQHLSQAAAGAAGATSAGGKRLPADKLCESCLAFAQLGAAATGEPPVLAQAGPSHAWDPALPVLARAGIAPQPRSRGPPFFH